jgi:SecD/SecF fusion protein
MCKFNFVKNFKYIVIAIMVVIVAGLAVLGFAGFNGSYEYKGGYEIRVVTEEAIGDMPDKIQNAAQTYLDREKVHYDVKKIDEGRIFIFSTAKKVSDTQIAGLKTAVEEATSNIYTIEVAQNEVSTYEVKAGIGYTLLATAIIIVVAFLYSLIKYRVAMALSMLITCLAQALLTIALLAVTRIVITPAVVMTTVLGFALTIVYSFYFASKVKEDGKNVANKGVVSAEIAEGATKASLGFVLSVLAVVIVAVIAIAILGSTYLVWTAINLLVSAIAFAVASLGVTGGIYSLLKKDNKN